MNYGSVFQTWRDATPIWSAYTNHAFVKGLGDGTLPTAMFLHYLKQDYVFLIHFARAWALAITKADTVAEMRLAASTVNGLINEEIALHIKTCADAGIDEVALFATQERAANLAYTRYVLDAGHSGDLLDLLAALAPCVMGYGEIGTSLETSKTSEKYTDWIKVYAGDDYQQVCRDVGALVDAAVTRRLGNHPQSSPRWATLLARFEMATKLEIGFWDMGLTP
ncbi:thiaminase II [Cognatiyoonia sp. IB215446]|uniref:thiaminase II n=1 Tax=Cognatiyoonia sp. IB215446 TaxID=3097355 RepID=UPI002A14E9EF|nr:thiaminase II [Cognatiyoonia sp. IB215446]MDX8348602.1 thiaminase II [Cognatiyoonia sp. IB215446]